MEQGDEKWKSAMNHAPLKPQPVRPNYFAPVLLAALLYVVIASFRILSPILLSFLLIVLFGMAVNPLIARLRRLSGGRARATTMVVLGFFLIMGLLGWAFYKPLKSSTTRFVQRLPEYWERIQKPLLKMETKAVLSEQRVKEEVTREVQNESPTNTLVLDTNANAKVTIRSTNTTVEASVESAAPPPAPAPDRAQSASPSFMHSAVSQLLTGVSSSFKSLAINVASMVVVFVTVFFGVVFTLLNPRPLIISFFGLIPQNHHPTTLRVCRRVVEFVPQWALATLLSMLTIGVLTFLIMWPLLGFQDALLLGAIAGILEAIPYIGPILSSIPGILLALGEGGMTPLWVLCGYLVVQALENNVVTPLIMAGRLELHPLAVIFSMLVCVALFGVLGVLLAAPLVAVLQILHEEVYRPRFLPDVTDEDLEKLSSIRTMTSREQDAGTVPLAAQTAENQGK